MRIFFAQKRTFVNLTQFKKTEHATRPHFLLIGNPVAHSLSPLMHNTAALHYDMPVRYHAVQLQRRELGTFAAYLNNDNLNGCNVTIPYKEAMLQYVDTLDDTCREIGALNTVVKVGNHLAGYNTDAYGFCEPLHDYEFEREGRAVVFGTGGAARAIAYGLQSLGMEGVLLVSRNPQTSDPQQWPDRCRTISYDAWPSFAEETELLVNATPLGMEPNIQASPIKDEEVLWLEDKLCYDIVYKPLETKFIRQAKRANARTIGGLEMLIQQGSRSFELWTGKPFPLQAVRDAIKDELENQDAD